VTVFSRRIDTADAQQHLTRTRVTWLPQLDAQFDVVADAVRKRRNQEVMDDFN
jgi:hypothetical protein